MVRREEVFVVVNHSAARARGAWGAVRGGLVAGGVAFEAHEARELGDARRAAADALRAGFRTIAVVGGDGTLGEVANGFFENVGGAGEPSPISPQAALAVLPAGTGNDFARAIFGRPAPLEDWIARLVTHCRGAARDGGAATGVRPAGAGVRAVDLMHGSVGGGARQFLCLNAVTLGIGAEVAAAVAAQGAAARRLPGEARFALAALGALARWREREVTVSVDGAPPAKLTTNLVAVVNSRFAGGGMMFSPGARIDDGLLDVVTARGLSRRVLLRELTRIHAGGHVNNPRVRVEHARSVRVEPATPADALPVEADGDVRGTLPLELRVLPGALRVVT
jgi:diacylglycerol kinase family enzyme